MYFLKFNRQNDAFSLLIHIISHQYEQISINLSNAFIHSFIFLNILLNLTNIYIEFFVKYGI